MNTTNKVLGGTLLLAVIALVATPKPKPVAVSGIHYTYAPSPIAATRPAQHGKQPRIFVRPDLIQGKAPQNLAMQNKAILHRPLILKNTGLNLKQRTPASTIALPQKRKAAAVTRKVGATFKRQASR